MAVHEIYELSLLIVEIGDCFMVRRTLNRLESDELTLQEAIVLLRSLGAVDPTRAQDILSMGISRQHGQECRGLYARLCRICECLLMAESRRSLTVNMQGAA